MLTETPSYNESEYDEVDLESGMSGVSGSSDVSGVYCVGKDGRDGRDGRDGCRDGRDGRDANYGINYISNGKYTRADEWTTDIENLIKHWKDQTEKLSTIHQESGYINKVRYYRLALPSIILPFTMTLISQNLQEGEIKSADIVNGVMFMATSVLSALALFFSYSKLSEEHFQTSCRYNDISNRIESELARKRRFRTPSDVFLTEIKSKIESLGDNSPSLPGTWC